MDKVQDILDYLAALANELARIRAKQQYHILVSGGAWMMLFGQAGRATEDIDFALVAPAGQPVLNQVFTTTVLRKQEIAKRSSRGEFAQAVRAVAVSHGLDEDWMNDEAASYLYDDAPQAEIYLWQAWPNLFVYLPVSEYIFALKIAAYRQKDRADCKALAAALNLHSAAEGQRVVNLYLTAEAQAFWEVPKKLRRLFR